MEERLCVVKGVSLPEKEALRLVLSPEWVVVPDVLEKLPGAAVWITCSAEVLEEARQRNILETAFAHTVSLPEQLETRIEQALLRRVQELVSLARRSGMAVCGFEKVSAWIGHGEVAMRFEAYDLGKTGRERMARSQKKALAVCRLLSREELGIPFGRAQCGNLAVRGKQFSAEILKELHRLSGFRKMDVL